MKPNASAVLLPLGAERTCSVALHTFSEYVTDAVRFLDLPHARSHGNRLYLWGEHMVPVVDLGVLLGLRAKSPIPSSLLIVKYVDTRRSARSYGALQIVGEPLRVQVSDDMMSELPQEPYWTSIAASCFTHSDRAVPILDLSQVFGVALADARAELQAASELTAYAA